MADSSGAETPKSKRAWALAYAAAKMPVFPVLPYPLGDAKSKGKTPAVQWKSWSTWDADKIDAWWSDTTPRINRDYGEYVPADCNIGVDTRRFGDGKALVVIDLDVKKGQNGIETFSKLITEFGLTDIETLQVSTPSGGVHIYTWHDTIIGDSVRKRPGIDVRSDGYVLGAGSVIDGKAYQIVGGGI